MVYNQLPRFSTEPEIDATSVRPLQDRERGNGVRLSLDAAYLRRHRTSKGAPARSERHR